MALVLLLLWLSQLHATPAPTGPIQFKPPDTTNKPVSIPTLKCTLEAAATPKQIKGEATVIPGNWVAVGCINGYTNTGQKSVECPEVSISYKWMHLVTCVESACALAAPSGNRQTVGDCPASLAHGATCTFGCETGSSAGSAMTVSCSYGKATLPTYACSVDPTPTPSPTPPTGTSALTPDQPSPPPSSVSGNAPEVPPSPSPQVPSPQVPPSPTPTAAPSATSAPSGGEEQPSDEQESLQTSTQYDVSLFASVRGNNNTNITFNLAATLVTNLQQSLASALHVAPEQIRIRHQAGASSADLEVLLLSIGNQSEALRLAREGNDALRSEETLALFVAHDQKVGTIESQQLPLITEARQLCSVPAVEGAVWQSSDDITPASQCAGGAAQLLPGEACSLAPVSVWYSCTVKGNIPCLGTGQLAATPACKFRLHIPLLVVSALYGVVGLVSLGQVVYLLLPPVSAGFALSEMIFVCVIATTKLCWCLHLSGLVVLPINLFVFLAVLGDSLQRWAVSMLLFSWMAVMAVKGAAPPRFMKKTYVAVNVVSDVVKLGLIVWFLMAAANHLDNRVPDGLPASVQVQGVLQDHMVAMQTASIVDALGSAALFASMCYWGGSLVKMISGALSAKQRVIGLIRSIKLLMGVMVLQVLAMIAFAIWPNSRVNNDMVAGAEVLGLLLVGLLLFMHQSALKRKRSKRSKKLSKASGYSSTESGSGWSKRNLKSPTLTHSSSSPALPGSGLAHSSSSFSVNPLPGTNSSSSSVLPRGSSFRGSSPNLASINSPVSHGASPRFPGSSAPPAARAPSLPQAALQTPPLSRPVPPPRSLKPRVQLASLDTH